MSKDTKFIIDRDKLELTEEEKAIDAMLEQNPNSVPNLTERKREIEQIARNSYELRTKKADRRVKVKGL